MRHIAPPGILPHCSDSIPYYPLKIKTRGSDIHSPKHIVGIFIQFTKDGRNAVKYGTDSEKYNILLRMLGSNSSMPSGRPPNRSMPPSCQLPTRKTCVYLFRALTHSTELIVLSKNRRGKYSILFSPPACIIAFSRLLISLILLPSRKDLL